ncbi:MAG: class I SAM-dependent methyltransferase [Chloroflexi bacterium]|nr:class I SAM-dependent methyltransferase [Chloroflexota bacterium]
MTTPAARMPLPTDVDGLPPLPAEAAASLDAGLATLGATLRPATRGAIEDHLRLLLAWNAHVNLTAIRDPVDAMRLHVLDALSAVPVISDRLSVVGSLADIGSGGGMPGLPLGLALGVERVTLIESVGRKARFLDAVAGLVECRPGHGTRVEVAATRAEDLAAGPGRATWDVVTVRAVGTMREIVELALPLTRVGGLVVCWKRERADGEPSPSLAAEIDEARPLIGQLGGDPPTLLPVVLEDLPDHRLVVVRKTAATPRPFPRPPAERRRRQRTAAAC